VIVRGNQWLGTTGNSRLYFGLRCPAGKLLALDAFG
jgi:hypothetical protein